MIYVRNWRYEKTRFDSFDGSDDAGGLVLRFAQEDGDAFSAIQADGERIPVDKLSGQLRIRRDSIIWLSVTATMGVEAVRAKVSNDSIWVINRLDKTYLAEPIDALSALIGMPLSLPVIQSLLLDNNEGLPPVEHQTVQLQSHLMGGVSAKIKYDNVRVDKETGFPLKITDKMKRIGLNKRN